VVTGWFHDESRQGAWLVLRCPRSGGSTTQIARIDSPDVAEHFGEPPTFKERFRFSADEREDCVMVAEDGRGPVVKLRALRSGAEYELGSGELHIDVAPTPRTLRAPTQWVGLRTTLDTVYRFGLPVLVTLGFWAALVALLRVRRTTVRGRSLLAAAIGLWVLVVSRVLILTLVDISAFPAINSLYMSAGFPLVIVAAVTSLVAAAVSGLRLP
jgi:hypothetical protein